MALLPPPSRAVTGRIEEYDSYSGRSTPSEQADDGIDASICARSVVPALIPRRSAAYPGEDAPHRDLMEAVAVVRTTRVSNLLM
jgi:hypothetical protein